MSGVYVFLGPTLPREDAARELDATFLPPVAQGDVLRLCAQKPAAIGIIDGFFESVPSVWHKEILYAIHAGIPVFGASSMGALRAAELYPFGMIGVGAIFEAYRDGRLEDDDEVAVIHGPAELGYTALSEAMVNIRRTLSDAVAERVLAQDTALRLEAIAKELPYRDRGYGRMLRLGGDIGLSAGELAAFRQWLPQGRFDQKRNDAKAMLRTMARRLGRAADPRDAAAEARFHFEHTVLWDRALREAAPLAM
ncbi:TfuA-like protein [Azospirillum sp. TSO35-2]|uniref:TfuA-like protein n=1 Tax=Azospirillum sp. TSO35-2 TaxID=716796 RepID=UPI000D61F087|nr:TfuA-like protein [Azospirillum sp. TSO35-2]PWC37507.1 tfuA protein [Azospirillum sp. TSO35-2]